MFSPIYRSAMLLPAILTLTMTFAGATPNDLSNGVFLVHHPPGLVYSAGEEWCSAYEDHAIYDCSEQNPRIDIATESVWYVLAAWSEEKVFCGAEFGFAAFDPSLYSFLEWGPCGSEYTLELSSDGWPGPLEGTAFVDGGVAWTGTIVPIYYFVGITYGEGIIPLALDPQQAFAGTVTCPPPYPATMYDAVCLGAMGLHQDGLPCYPEDPTPARSSTWGQLRALYR